MKEYLVRVVGIILICSILMLIIPNKGKNAGIIYGAMKIICLLVIISPLLSFFQNKASWEFDKMYSEFFSDSVIQVDKDFIKYYSETTIAYYEKELEREILEKYNYNVSISFDWEQTVEDFQQIYPDMKVKIIQICVGEAEELNEEEKRILSEFLMNNYCSEVLIE